jgi:hypothetical protein
MTMMNIEHQTELPTPRSMARTSYRVHVWCRCAATQGCRPGSLIAGGRGDVPLIQTRWRCGNCGSRLTDFVVVSFVHATREQTLRDCTGNAFIASPVVCGRPGRPHTS